MYGNPMCRPILYEIHSLNSKKNNGPVQSYGPLPFTVTLIEQSAVCQCLRYHFSYHVVRWRTQTMVFCLRDFHPQTPSVQSSWRMQAPLITAAMRCPHCLHF